MNIILIIVILSGVAMYLISNIMIYEYLHHRNDKIPNLFYVNVHISKFVDKYKRITKGQHRRTGAIYYLWIISIFITLSSAILLLVINIIIM
jgi:hypothetical protein